MDLATDNLITGLREGDPKIFEQIFRKYYPLLCYEARSYVKSYDLIEEIVCDVFTRIWQNRENITIQTSLRDYLIKSVHNNSIDYYRQLKRKEMNQSIIETDDKTRSTVMDLNESPLDYILTQELEERINSLIELLPTQYKRAFKLSRIKNLTYEEIAVEMKISINSVKTNIKNALSFLRKELNSFL